MKFAVIITLKKDVLDPQGKVIQQTLQGIGINTIKNLRQGKYIEIQLNETDESKAHSIVENMCKKLLANLKIENGKLIIQATFDTAFKSAKLTSSHKIDFHKGYIEISAKLPSCLGTWPAIWMLPSLNRSLQWPLDGEIDIMENVGYNSHQIFGTIHTSSYNHMNGTQLSDSIAVQDPNEVYHTYALNWTDSILEWYVDDSLYNKIKRKKSDQIEEWPFDKKFHLIINQAVGGNWGGKHGVDTLSYPQLFYVDYIRLYEKKPIKKPL